MRKVPLSYAAYTAILRKPPILEARGPRIDDEYDWDLWEVAYTSLSSGAEDDSAFGGAAITARLISGVIISLRNDYNDASIANMLRDMADVLNIESD